MRAHGPVYRCCVLVALAFTVMFAGTAKAAVPELNDRSQLDDRADLIKLADNIKTSNHAQFVKLLYRLDHDPRSLSEQNAWYLRYLDAWEVAYDGNYDRARPMLNAIIDSHISSVRFRAAATLINILGISRHYQDAFTLLNKVLDQLPQITDNDSRIQVLGEAAQFLIAAGQYDLAVSYSDQLLADNRAGRGACIGIYSKLDALMKSGRMDAADPRFKDGLNICEAAQEGLAADSIRRDMATAEINAGHATEAIRLLQNHYADVLSYQYPDLTSEFNALLAQAYWKAGDAIHAQKYAQAAIDTSVKNEFTVPLSNAYQLLYEIAEQQGKIHAALLYHEKYMIADKGTLDDVSEKALAYQIVRQQVEAKKVEVEALNKQNQILTLHRALDEQNAKAGRLYIALLLTVLASIGLWLFRLKRSQLRFMRLARRDGLTGIFNRQHFVDEAERCLRYAAKSQRAACLILIDLDHFKLINDTHGHAVGDQVLKGAVSACATQLTSRDLLGRLGGEEFGILLPETDIAAAQQRAEQMREAIAATPGVVETAHILASASFGIATTAQRGYELRQLLIGADAALYRAKHEGRNRVVLDNNNDSSTVSGPAGSLLRVVDNNVQESSFAQSVS